MSPALNLSSTVVTAFTASSAGEAMVGAAQSATPARKIAIFMESPLIAAMVGGSRCRAAAAVCSLRARLSRGQAKRLFLADLAPTFLADLHIVLFSRGLDPLPCRIAVVVANA